MPSGMCVHQNIHIYIDSYHPIKLIGNSGNEFKENHLHKPFVEYRSEGNQNSSDHYVNCEPLIQHSDSYYRNLDLEEVSKQERDSFEYA